MEPDGSFDMGLVSPGQWHLEFDERDGEGRGEATVQISPEGRDRELVIPLILTAP